ncbi:MAG: hypothetical protein LBO74_02155 [Candidatus Symbiothrix sp.]|jgi:hypothetical protein|nr:hypothetical protein [Candidatus Symbiothrix sp.]
MKKIALFILLSFVSYGIKSQTSADQLWVWDTGVNEAPSAFSRQLRIDFKQRSTIGVPGDGTFSGNLTIAPWDSYLGGPNHQLNFNEGGIFYRTGYHGSSWNDWRKVLVEGPSGVVGINGSGATGGALAISNSSKTQAGEANEWRIYNMTSPYGNSLQFWAYDAVQNCAGGLCANRFTLMDNGNVGIGTMNPTAKLEVDGTIRATETKIGTGWVSGNFRLGDIGDGGNLNVPLGSLTKQYNIDFTGYWDSAPDLVGARIAALRHNNWQDNIAGIQSTSLAFYTNPSGAWTSDLTERMRITPAGNIGIGTMNPQNLLDVNGTIRAKEVKVETGWADFVFNEDYNLRPLSEVNTFIKANKHLPEIPTASEVKSEGVNLGEMQTKLLQKVEELTLYLIQQENTIQELKSEIQELKAK